MKSNASEPDGSEALFSLYHLSMISISSSSRTMFSPQPLSHATMT